MILNYFLIHFQEKDMRPTNPSTIFALVCKLTAGFEILSFPNFRLTVTSKRKKVKEEQN